MVLQPSTPKSWKHQRFRPRLTPGRLWVCTAPSSTASLTGVQQGPSNVSLLELVWTVLESYLQTVDLTQDRKVPALHTPCGILRWRSSPRWTKWQHAGPIPMWRGRLRPGQVPGDLPDIST